MMRERVRKARVGDEKDRVAVAPEYSAKDRVAQSHRVSHDRVEHRLHVGRRLADHAENLARRGLSIERYREVSIANFKLAEEPHVLDGDDRLVGERLEQPDLALRERTWLGPSK